MKKACVVIGLVGMLLGSLGRLVCATVMNGDFSAGLTSWMTEDMDTNSLFTSPSRSVVEMGGEAMLMTQGITSGIVQVSLFQPLTIPVLAMTLSFDIGITRGSTNIPPGGATFPDFLEVSYLDDADANFDRAFVGLAVNGAYDPPLGPL